MRVRAWTVVYETNKRAIQAAQEQNKTKIYKLIKEKE